MGPLAKLAVVTGGVGAAAVLAWVGATSWHPSVAVYPIQGIDLAENPPAVDWGTVRADGADFAYLVATSGTDRRDPGFEGNWAALPEAGLRRGAVHLYSLCQDPQAQANAFNTVVPADADALPAAVDVEQRPDCTADPDPATLARDLAGFMRTAEAHTGKPMLLRISRAAERRYHLSAAIDRPVWVMADGVRPGYAARPWRMWRASDVRRIDGVEGPVNWDVVAP